MAVIQNLVEQIVDYAGLFPPAALPLPEVAENYAAYSRGPWAWMLGRLVIPASRLDELSKIASYHFPREGADGWMISALLPPLDAKGTAVEQGVEQIQAFNCYHETHDSGLARVDTVEVKTSHAEWIHNLTAIVPDDWNTFCEIPHDVDPEPWIEAIQLNRRDRRLFAKIRTGGMTPDRIPTAEQVARFLRRCAEFRVGLKATAGLHHPLRGRYRLSYEPDAPQGTMFGFLNVFLAACFAFGAKASQRDLVQILKASDLNDFEFGPLAVRWKNLDVPASRISEIRFTKAISFGSCSFDEPTQELNALGLLAAQT